jgi:hypothetical protein
MMIPRYQTQALADEIRTLVEVAFTKACKDSFHTTSGGTHSRAPPTPTPLHLLRFLSHAVDYRSLRHFAVLNIDGWLNHPTTNRAAKRLLGVLADEIGKACTTTQQSSATAAAMSKVNILSVTSQSVWE